MATLVDLQRAVATSVDADRPELERVEALWRLAGLLASTRVSGRTLVEHLAGPLREPLLFVSTEAAEVLATLVVDPVFAEGVDVALDAADEIAVGVGGRGELVVSRRAFSACVSSTERIAWCPDIDVGVRRLSDLKALRAVLREPGFLQLVPSATTTDLLVELAERTVRVCRDHEFVDPRPRGGAACDRSPARLQLERQRASWIARGHRSVLRATDGDVVPEVVVDGATFVTLAGIPIRLVPIAAVEREGGVIYDWWPRSPARMRTRPAAIGEVVRIGRARLDDFPDPRLSGHVVALGDDRFGVVLVRPELRVKVVPIEQLKKVTPWLTAKSMRPRI